MASSRSRRLEFVLAADAKQVTRAFTQVEKSGDRLAKHTEHTHGRVQKSYAASAKSALKMAAGVTAAYVSIAQAKAAINATEELAKTTQGLHRNLGLTIREASRWGAVAKARGIDTKSLNMSFTTLSKTVEAGLSGDKKRIELFRQLGLTQDDLKRGTHDFSGLVTQLADGFGKLHGGTQRQAAAQQLLGRGYQSVLPLFAEGSKSLQEQLKWADKYGVTLTTKTIGPINELIKSQRELKVGQLGIQVGFTKLVTPALLEVEHAGLRVLKVMNDPDLTGEQKWKKISGIVTPIANSIGDGVTAAIPKIAEGVGHHAPQVAGAFVKGFVKADAWGKLAIGAWLFAKFGGIGAFSKMGRRGGAAMGTGMAEGAAVGTAAGKGGFRAAGALAGKFLGAAAVASFIAQWTRLPEDFDPLLFLHPPDAGDPRPGHGDVVAPGGHSRGRDRHGQMRTQPRGALAGREFEFDSGSNAIVAVSPKVAKAMRDYGLSAKEARQHVHALSVTNAKAAPALKTLGELTQDVTGKQRRQSRSATELRGDIAALRVRLANLNKGSAEYRETAELMRRKQRQLNETVEAGKPAADHARSGFRTLGRSVSGLTDTVRLAASQIGGTTNKVLRGFGAKQINLGLQSVSSGAEAAVKAGGGWIGSRGEAGTDSVPIVVGRGEAVLNRHQQGPVEYALHKTFGMGLDQLFEKVQRPHHMAQGGRANFGGHPSNVTRGIRNLIATMQGRFPLAVTSTTDHGRLTTSGNVSDHTTGHAVDLAADSSTMYRASEWIKRSGAYRSLKQGIHNPNLAVNAGQLQRPPGQFAGAVWGQHASHIHLALAGAFGPVIQKLARLLVTGPAGPLRDIAQGSADRMRGAANRFLSRGSFARGGIARFNHAYPRMFVGQKGEALSVGEVIEIARGVGFDNTAAKHFAEIAHGESGYHPGMQQRDPGDGMVGYGLLQMTPNAWGPAGKAHMNALGGIPGMFNPVKNMLMARYLFKEAGNDFDPWHGTAFVTGEGGGLSGSAPSIRRVLRGGGGSSGGGGGRSSFSGRGPGLFALGGSEGPARGAGPPIRPPAPGPRGFQMTPTFRPGPHMTAPNTVDAEGNIVFPDKPTAEDYLASAAAQAALTADTQDDIDAAQAAVTYGTTAYQQAIASGDPRKIAAAATNLKGWQDALKSLQDAVEANTEQLASAMKDLADQLKRSNDQHDAVQAIGEKTALDMLTGLISGRIGARVQQRQAVRTFGSPYRA